LRSSSCIKEHYSEVRFLRKLCGYSVTEFAEIMGSNKTVIYRWKLKIHTGRTLTAL